MPNYKKLLAIGATALGDSLLSNIADGVLDKALSTVGLEDVQLDEIQSEVHAISQQMDSLAKEVKAIQISINNLETQLSNVMLQLKMDSLEEKRIEMDTLYTRVTYVIKSLATNLITDSSGQLPAKKKRALKGDRAELRDLLEEAKNTLPKLLRTLHEGLKKKDENSVLELAARKINDENPDVITYYLRMVAYMAPYWLAQTQAIGLLATAQKHPDLHFTEGTKLTEDCEANIEKQQQVFRDVVGPQLCDLVEELMRSAEKQEESMRSSGKQSPPSALVNFYATAYRHVIPTEKNEHVKVRTMVFWDNRHMTFLKYRLYAKFNCTAESLKPEEAHIFQLFLEDHGQGGKLCFEDTDFNLKDSDNLAGSVAYLDESLDTSQTGFLENGNGDLCLTWNKRHSYFGVRIAGRNKELVSDGFNSLDLERIDKRLATSFGGAFFFPSNSSDFLHAKDQINHDREQLTRLAFAQFQHHTTVRALFMRTEGQTDPEGNRWWFNLVS